MNRIGLVLVLAVLVAGPAFIHFARIIIQISPGGDAIISGFEDHPLVLNGISLFMPCAIPAVQSAFVNDFAYPDNGTLVTIPINYGYGTETDILFPNGSEIVLPDQSYVPSMTVT